AQTDVTIVARGRIPPARDDLAENVVTPPPRRAHDPLVVREPGPFDLALDQVVVGAVEFARLSDRFDVSRGIQDDALEPPPLRRLDDDAVEHTLPPVRRQHPVRDPAPEYDAGRDW